MKWKHLDINVKLNAKTSLQKIHSNNYSSNINDDTFDKLITNDDVTETLEALERGGMVKDYNSNSTNLDSEDDDDPRTPASVSSQVMINCKLIQGVH